MKILDQHDRDGVVVMFSEQDDIIPRIKGLSEKKIMEGKEYIVCRYTNDEWDAVQYMLNGIIPKSIPKKKGT